VPLPLPLAPLVTDNQFALLDADQPHPLAVVTSNEPVPPPAGTDAEPADNENVQPCPWLTVKVRPAIVSVPDRAGPVVAATVKATVPLPLPLAPDVIEIHGWLLTAVHAHPLADVTAALPVPPDAGTLLESGATEKVQPCDCTTVTVCPATVTVPVRGGPFVGAIANVTLPDPWPAAPAVTVIHGTPLDAVH
jgi:hypothetical protein